MMPNDVVMAFFPCTRFEDQIMLYFRGERNGTAKWTDLENLQQGMKLHEELHDLYLGISKLAVIAIRRRLRMVIENPYSAQHYLKQYWCLRPAIIDKDRSKSGDYFRKPTQYWFIGFKPLDNLVFEPLDHVDTLNLKKATKTDGNGVDRKLLRSLIHPQYASRFIRQYILPYEVWQGKETE